MKEVEEKIKKHLDFEKNRKEDERRSLEERKEMTEVDAELRKFFAQRNNKPTKENKVISEERSALIKKDKDRVVVKLNDLLGEIGASKVTRNKEREKEEWSRVDSLLEQLKNLWDIQLEIQCDIVRECVKNGKMDIKEKSREWETYIQ